MSDRLTPRQTFCAPLLSALLFGGGNAGISDIYVHIRDIVPLRAINDFVRLGVLREDGHARWGITEKGFAVAREFQLVSNDGVLIDRSLLRKRLGDFAAEFERMYKVYSRPAAAPAT